MRISRAQLTRLSVAGSAALFVAWRWCRRRRAARGGARLPVTTLCAGTTALREIIEEELICPITRALMVDPVVTLDGQMYERAAIESFWAAQRRRGEPIISPATNLPLRSDQLVPVHALRSTIARLVDSGALDAEIVQEYRDSVREASARRGADTVRVPRARRARF